MCGSHQRRAGVGHPPAGQPGTDLAAEARAWAEGSCAEQGLPVKVADGGTLSVVCELLGARGSLLDAPDGLEAARIESVVPTPTGIHDDVRQDGRDNGALPSQREVAPSVP